MPNQPEQLLRISQRADSETALPAGFAFGWILAILVTLGGLVALYRWLRRQLRPWEAIQRNLDAYSAGLERELITLTLSDTLGAAASQWNMLIGELSALHRRLAQAQEGGTREVLARFEGAVFRRVVDRLPFGVLWVVGERSIRYANPAAAALLGRDRSLLNDAPVQEVFESQAVQQAIASARVRPGAWTAVDHVVRAGTLSRNPAGPGAAGPGRARPEPCPPVHNADVAQSKLAGARSEASQVYAAHRESTPAPDTAMPTPASAGRDDNAAGVKGADDPATTLRFRVSALAGHGETAEPLVLVTIEDITQLREDQRTRDEFLYHVTHELRTPLTNIHAYAETLTRPGFDDEQTRKECYNVLISETQRLSRLVEDVLSISQMEVGTARLELGEVDLVRLVRQMVQDNLGTADEKKIELTLSLPPKVPKIRGDKQRLAVLLNNVIGNAVKYTPAGGSVQVKVQVDDQDQQIRIVVADDGIGIAPADQQRIFDKFYRAADEKVQQKAGTGLGLALAREVARLHGGEIYLQSELGKGSTFTIELPVATSRRTEVAVR